MARILKAILVKIMKTDPRFEYSSPAFGREWDWLYRDGWTIIYVDAQMCKDTQSFYRAIELTGSGWRYWYGGGYDVITDDPDFLLDYLEQNSSLAVVLEPDWGGEDG